MGCSRLDLGVGLVAAPGLDIVWERIADLVQVVEVEPQTLWDRRPGGGWQLHEPGFAWLAGLPVPRLAHGVGFPVGGITAPDPAGVALAAASAVRLAASHWSEHLSFNRAVRHGEALDAGFLLPPSQTWAGVEAAASHVGEYRRLLDIPFLVETGVSYLRPCPGELSDGTFVASIAERADCGILLDLHNAWTNQRNGRQPVADLVDQLPLERVLELHLAGGFEVGGYYLDAHSGRVSAELLEIAARVLPRLENLRAVVYETLPEDLMALGGKGLRGVLEDLHRLVRAGSGRSAAGRGRRGPRWRSGPGRARRPGRAQGTSRVDRRDAAEWERRVLAYTTRATERRPADDPGLDILRLLTDQARIGRIAESQPEVLQSLLQDLGGDRARALLVSYLRACPARLFTDDEGDAFVDWLGTMAGCRHGGARSGALQSP